MSFNEKKRVKITIFTCSQINRTWLDAPPAPSLCFVFAQGKKKKKKTEKV
jgi:hypothetical protein